MFCLGLNCIPLVEKCVSVPGSFRHFNNTEKIVLQLLNIGNCFYRELGLCSFKLGVVYTVGQWLSRMLQR